MLRTVLEQEATLSEIIQISTISTDSIKIINLAATKELLGQRPITVTLTNKSTQQQATRAPLRSTELILE